ncbi:MAG: DUF11 domain-containing protein, partial [Anaerolineae bacterium]
MRKRFALLFVSVSLPLLFLQMGLFPPLLQAGSSANLHDVIFNEWSQGNGGAKEWVELLVVRGPADLRGWDVGDDTPGDLTFSQASLWTAVPTGTLIVIYNTGDRDTVLPPDDTDPSDCVLVLSDEDATLFSGRLPAFSNGSPSDKPHLRDDLGTTIHDFGSEPGTVAVAGGETAVFTGTAASGVGNPANWRVTAASAATPGAGNGGANSAWVDGLCQPPPPAANLAVAKTVAITVLAGQPLTYQITLSNTGALTATAVTLTDSLPAGVTYLSDDAGLPLAQPDGRTLVWLAGDMPPGSGVRFQLAVSASVTASGWLTNEIVAATAVTETTLADNRATAVTWADNHRVLIDRVLYDGYELGELDEAVRLINLNGAPVDVSGW